jgi:hypothetical protein
VQIEGGGEIIVGTFEADSDAVTVIIAGLIASLQAQPGFSGTASATNSDPDLDLVFLNTGISYVISFPSNPGSNMSVANSQTAGGTNVGLGLVVAQGGDGEAVLPTGEPLAQTSVITLGGTDDGVYTVTITGNGFTWVGTITASSDTAPVILAAILAGMEGDLGFDADCDGSVAATVLTFVFNKPGIAYTVALTVNQDTNMVLTTPVVAQDGDVMLGVTSRNIDIETNVGGDGDTEFEPGDTLSVVRQGVVTVRATETVTDGAPAFVRISSATVAEPLGSLSATDTANTTRLLGSRWRGARTGAGLSLLTVNIPIT